MPNIPAPASPSFRKFAEQVTADAFVERLAAGTAWPVEALRERLRLAAGEVAQTLRVLAGVAVADGTRMIEIGAGLGLASAFLSTCGFDITALEPSGVGFEEHVSVAGAVAALVGSDHVVLTIGAEELDESLHGLFGVIFSNNVLEHVHDPAAALRSLTNVMTCDGLMVHSCPNYSIPFEPHFGIPLLPVRPAWTRRVLPSSIGKSALWTSLNFIRARDVQRLARGLGLDVYFRSGSLAAAVERLGTDAGFRARHRMLAIIGRVLVAIGVTTPLQWVPASWSTPMDFLLGGPGLDRSRVASWLERVEPI